MKKGVTHYLAGAIAGAAMFLPALSAGAQTLVLKAADVQPAGYPTVQGLEFMSRYLKDVSHGTMTIKVYPSGQLGNEQSTIEQIQAGVIDLGRINAAPLAAFDQEIGVLSLPYLFKSKTDYWKVLSGPLGLKLLNSLSKAQMLGLAYYDSGQRSFYTTAKAGPIKTVKDLQGMRIRVQKSPVMVAMVKALGATPVPMAYGSVYSALQTGVIDGAENNLPSYGPYGVRHFEVAPNYTFDSHSRVPEVVLVSLKTWKRLNVQQRTWLREAALASVPVEEAAWNHLVGKTLKALKGKVHFYHVNVAQFQAAMQPVYKQYQAKYGKLIHQILATK